MNKTQDAWEMLDLDDEQGIERISQIADDKKTETKKSHPGEIDWKLEAGKWATRFWWVLFFWGLTILIFAYVADSLSVQIDMLTK